MAGTLGGLLVSLGLDSTSFDSGMDKSEQRMKQLSVTAVAMGTAIGEAVTEGVKKAYDVLLEFSEGAIKAAAHLKDLATQTGITVESLAGLERVGKFSSTSIDTIAAASNKLNRALITSGEHSNAAARSIKALGLDFETLKHQGPEEQLTTIAGALAKFADGTGKGDVAMSLFNRSGAQFLTFLKELGERGVMTTAMTQEMADAAKEYEAQVITLGFRMDDLKVRLGQDLLPVMQQVVQIFLDLQHQTTELDDVLNPLTVTLQTLAVVGIQLGVVFLGLGREMGAWAAQTVAITEGINATDWFNGQASLKMAENWRKGGFTAISDMVKADGEAARVAADKAIAAIMSAPARARLLAHPEQNMDARDRQLAQMSQRPLLNVPGVAPKATGDRTSEAEKYLETLQKLLAKQKELADTGLKQTEIEKVLSDLKLRNIKGLTPLLEAQIIATAKAVTTSELMIEADKLDAEQLKKSKEELLKKVEAEKTYYDHMVANIDALDKSNTSMQHEIQLMGLTTAAKADLERAWVEEEIAIKQNTLARLAQQPEAQAEYDLLQLEIAALEKKRGLLLDKAVKQDEIDAKVITDKTASTMSESLAQGIMDGFRKGHSLADIFLNELKAQFAKTVLVPMLEPMVKAGNSMIEALMGNIIGGIGGGMGLDFGGMGTNTTGTSLPTAGGASGGGPISALSLRQVNEKRMEGLNLNGQQFLLMGKQGGSIDSNPNVGGININIPQVLNIGDGVTRNDLASGMVMAAEKAKADILRSMRTNGVFARTGAGG